MMDGGRYGLLSKRFGSRPDDATTVVHVKLTDAAVRAIDEFRRNKKRMMEKPTIQFYDNDGLIVFPGINGQNHEFRFTASDIKPESALSTFECIKQDRTQPVLSTVGEISKKLSVMANDDVYQATKQKMNLVEEESRKQCAKVIDRFDPDKGRKIKKPVRPSSLGVNQPAAAKFTTSSCAHQFSQSSPIDSAPRQVIPRAPEVARPGVPSAAEARSPVFPGAATNTVAASMPNGSSSLKPLANSAAINFPYRDRIIHLLAVRPYKKIELVQRLQRDGIRDKEKNQLSQILQQIALFKNNTYSLLRHVYSEVRVDWPFYTDDQRQLVKRMLEGMQELSGSGVNSTISSPTLSPCLSSGSSQGSPVAPALTASTTQVSQSLKRALPDDIKYYEPAKKQQRIAHTQKASPAAQPVANGGSAVLTSSQLPPSKSEKKAFVVENSLPVESQENFSQSATASAADYSNRAYVQIVSMDQRQHYKQDFVAEYDEYRRLYSKMAERMQIFKKLKEQLSQESNRNPDTYEAVKEKIMDEYRRLQSDSKYLSDRQRCNYLHAKLGHIKALVSDFDRRHLGLDATSVSQS